MNSIINLWLNKNPTQRSKATIINGVGMQQQYRGGWIHYEEGRKDFHLVHFHNTVNIWLNGDKIEAPKNTFMIWAPGTAQRFGTQGKRWAYSWLHFDGAMIEDLLINCQIKTDTPYHLNNSYLSNKFLQLIYEEVNYFKPFNHIIIESYLSAWMESLKRSIYISGAHELPLRMQKAHSFISKNYKEKITLTDIGVVAGLGQSQLINEFKKYYNKTPIEHLMNVRLNHASNLLLNSKLTVSQVSFKLGFCNPFYFSKQFKNQFGLSPKKYITHHEKMTDQK